MLIILSQLVLQMIIYFTIAERCLSDNGRPTSQWTRQSKYLRFTIIEQRSTQDHHRTLLKVQQNYIYILPKKINETFLHVNNCLDINATVWIALQLFGYAVNRNKYQMSNLGGLVVTKIVCLTSYNLKKIIIVYGVLYHYCQMPNDPVLETSSKKKQQMS